jgi:hypothetical protein
MLPERSSRANTVRILTPASTARLLRAHLARHNLRILFLAFVTLLLAVALWILLYGLAYWLTLLAASARGISEEGIPRKFLRWFLAFALVSTAWVWLGRRLPRPEIPRDNKPLWEIAWEFLLAIPRITFSMFSTISAWRRLSPSELEQAASFIHRLAEERRLPLPSVPQEIPDARSRENILLTLQIMQIIDLQKRDRDWFVTLHVSRPRAFQFDRAGGDSA